MFSGGAGGVLVLLVALGCVLRLAVAVLPLLFRRVVLVLVGGCRGRLCWFCCLVGLGGGCLAGWCFRAPLSLELAFSLLPWRFFPCRRLGFAGSAFFRLFGSAIMAAGWRPFRSPRRFAVLLSFFRGPAWPFSLSGPLSGPLPRLLCGPIDRPGYIIRGRDTQRSSAFLPAVPGFPVCLPVAIAARNLPLMPAGKKASLKNRLTKGKNLRQVEKPQGHRGAARLAAGWLFPAAFRGPCRAGCLRRVHIRGWYPKLSFFSVCIAATT